MSLCIVNNLQTVDIADRDSEFMQFSGLYLLVDGCLVFAVCELVPDTGQGIGICHCLEGPARLLLFLEPHSRKSSEHDQKRGRKYYLGDQREVDLMSARCKIPLADIPDLILNDAVPDKYRHLPARTFDRDIAQGLLRFTDIKRYDAFSFFFEVLMIFFPNIVGNYLL